MGILEGLKRTFNVAGSKITVVLEDKKYSQFDQIRGEVVVTAPEYKLAANAINLELKEFWTETRSTGKTTTTVIVEKQPFRSEGPAGILLARNAVAPLRMGRKSVPRRSIE